MLIREILTKRYYGSDLNLWAYNEAGNFENTYESPNELTAESVYVEEQMDARNDYVMLRL